jgi:hypothetical protein
MIGKIVIGRGFRGALEYDLKKEKGRMLDTNMGGQNPRQLAHEFGAFRQLRPNLSRAVFHASLSAAPGERLSDDQWRDIAERYLRGMGFVENQYVVTRHSDTAHEHIHILANRITFSGEVVSDSQDYKKQAEIMAEIERDFGLEPTNPVGEGERKAPSKGEIEWAMRTGEPSIKSRIQQLADAAANNCRTFSEYQERLEVMGVELIPFLQLEGAKLSGLMYRLDGKIMKGSDLGKVYSPTGMARKRKITYEKDRDFAAASRSLEREAARIIGESPQEQRGEKEGTERQNRGVAQLTLADKRLESRAENKNAGRAPADGGAGNRGARKAQEVAGLESILLGVGDRSILMAESEALVRELGWTKEEVNLQIRAFGGNRRAELSDEDLQAFVDRLHFEIHRSAPNLGIQPPLSPGELTLGAIRRQIGALSVAEFEVGIRDIKTGQMTIQQWTSRQLEDAVSWLKFKNTEGNDIYIRPARSIEHGFVLLDDLKKDALNQMIGDGFTPAAIIETSSDNYQAWVKLSSGPLSGELRKLAARELAQRYDADLNSADSVHFGRLAGFTNRKPERVRSNGQQPYVLAHDCSGFLATAAPALLQQLIVASHQAVKPVPDVAIPTVELGEGRDIALIEYSRQADILLEQFRGSEVDFSRLDWTISVDMAKSGRFSVEDIARSIRECSPHINTRKVGHIEDYANRTAFNAWNSEQVKQARQFSQRQAQRDRDKGDEFSL